MVKKLFVIVFLVLFCCQGVSRVLYADSAQVLPKGRFKVSSSGTYTLPYEHRFDPDGNVEDIATNFNALLDSQVFTSLTAVETGFGMTAGTGNVGRSYVDFEMQYSTLNHTFQYGVTDKWTVGIHIPYWWSKNTVKTFVDSSGATIGKTATGAGLGAPLDPIVGGFGDTVALSTEDILQILGPGLDVDGDGDKDIAGYGFKRLKTWYDEGFGDIEIGSRYQYLKTKDWRLAANFGIRLPTGTRNDPDNLVDFTPFSGETYALLFRFNQDFIRIKNNVFNTTFRYDYRLPDKQEQRVLDDVNSPLAPAANNERVDRKLGDIMQLEVSDSYSFFGGFNASLLYNYKFKLKDRVSGDKGLAYESLENETRGKSHVVKAGLSYSTIPLFMEKKFPIPLSFDFTYRYRFAGSDNSAKSQYMQFGLNIYF